MIFFFLNKLSSSVKKIDCRAKQSKLDNEEKPQNTVQIYPNLNIHDVSTMKILKYIFNSIKDAVCFIKKCIKTNNSFRSAFCTSVSGA